MENEETHEQEDFHQKRLSCAGLSWNFPISFYAVNFTPSQSCFNERTLLVYDSIDMA